MTDKDIREQGRKKMTKGEFAALMGRHSNSAEDVTLTGAIDLMKSVLSALMPSQQESDSDIRGTKILAWDGYSIILEDSEGNLYEVGTVGGDGLVISQSCGVAFNLLCVEDSLANVFDSDAVAEFHRLQTEYVAEYNAKRRDAERATYERLKAKFEG